jgi:hypothetical protein
LNILKIKRKSAIGKAFKIPLMETNAEGGRRGGGGRDVREEGRPSGKLVGEKKRNYEIAIKRLA